MEPPPPRAPTFREALRFWAWLGFVNFGGPAGQMALMHRELVERRRWLSEAHFLHALNFCMLLPGPEAQQLAIYVGWLLHRTWGGVVAGVLFVLPGLALLLLLAWLYVALGHLPLVAGLFLGLKAAVLAIVVEAVLRVGRRALRTPALAALAVATFAALAFFGVPFPVVVLGALALGFVGARLAPSLFVVAVAPHAGGAEGAADAMVDAPHARPDPRRAMRVLLAGLALWAVPLGLLLVAGPRVLADEALFFTKVALVTFGGAYAVLAYVAQVAVGTYGWLAPGQMVDGLGLAETTPGPLILVTVFVGFLGAWTHPGSLPPVVAGLLGGLVTAWFVFLPGFLLVLLGAPHVERLRGRPALQGALSAVTAAVVGVIANLAVYFGRGVLLAPGGVDVFALAVAAAAFLLLAFTRVGAVPVVLGGAVLGVAHALLAQ